MIRIINRYILRQYLVPLSYILCAFCLMYVIADLFERFPDFVQAKVPLLQVLQYYGYYLFAVNGFVPFIVVILPIVLLLGALYTLTMFARHNELTAMLASGVSIRRMMMPFLMVGLCASVFCAITQETVGPRATRWISEFNRQMTQGKGHSKDVMRDYFYHTGATHRQWQIGEFNPRKPNKLKKVKVNQERRDGSLAIEYVASRADYLDGRWWFYGLQQRAFNELGDPLGPITAPSETPQEMGEFVESPSDFVSELEKPDFLSSFEMMRYLDSRPDMQGPSRTRREVDVFSRLAMPWSCMVMILLSLPATAGGVRRPALRSVAFGLGALFVFYVLLQGGIILGKVGVIEPWLAGWLPNIAFLALGGLLTWRLR
jgi:lipopolysaccharide export system permease protein